MVGWLISWLAIVFVCLALAPAAPVSLTVAPKYSVRPRQDIRFTVRIDPHSDNRNLELIIDGPQYMSQSFDLDGADAAKISERWFKSVPPGQYVAAAVLLRANGKTFVARDTFCIIGPDADCLK